MRINLFPDYAEINHLPEEEFYNTLDRLKTACEKLASENVETESTPSIDSFKHKKKPGKKSKRQKSRPSTCFGPDIKGFGRIENKHIKFDTYKDFRDHIAKKELQKQLDSKLTYKKDEVKFESYKSFREHIDKKEKIWFNGEFKDNALDNKESSICGDDCKFNKNLEENLAVSRNFNTGDHHISSFEDHIPKNDEDSPRCHKNYDDPHPKNYDNYKSFREDLEKMFEAELEKNFMEYKMDKIKEDPPPKSFRIDQNEEILSVFQEDVPDEPINMINEAEIIRKYNKYFENTSSSPKADKHKSLSVNDLREDVESKLTLKEEAPRVNKTMTTMKRSFTSCHLDKNKPKVTVEILPPTPMKSKPQTFVSPFSLLLPKKQKKRPISASPVYPVARPNLAATLRREISKKKLEELDNHCTFRDTNTPQVDWEVRKTPAWKTLNLRLVFYVVCDFF